ncbi:hypothetical protein DSO57_1006069 [Entomophthora muscae]|uniref:Uncharacterized protein n=1 Tax=Entomophthora muscae TaxID=34485 RepID=A0ACC2U5K6_9FUNG|nr:hypothetical protein DSO57_1006069 [Entomophthora muscae]
MFLTGKVTSLLSSREIMVKILTCNNLDYHLPNSDLVPYSTKKTPETILPLPVKEKSAPLGLPVALESVPTYTPWLLTCLVLMGLNAYFPQLSHVFSLWSPFRAAIPVFHWIASW